MNGTVYSQGYLVHMLDLEVNEWVLCADTAETHAEIRGLRPGHLYRYILYTTERLAKDSVTGFLIPAFYI